MARRSVGLLVLCALVLVSLRAISGRRPPSRPGRGPVPAVQWSLAVDAVPPPLEEAELEVAVSTAPGAEAEPVPALEGRSAGKKQGKKKKDASDGLFEPGIVPRIAITIDRQGMRSLEADPRSYVEATVEADGTTYTRVGVHLKGAAGSFRPVRDRPALTLKFNKHIPGQKLHGLGKLHLNNSVQDRSYLNELLAGELFRAVGVPAARATQARVSLNGRDLGLYVLKEAFDRPFLRRHFQDDSGNLYDGGFCQDVDRGLENDTNRESEDRSDLERLIAAAAEDDLDERWRRLGQVLDLERFLSYIAVEVLLWDWDGYPMKPNNYRIYHDPTSDRLVFLPHGMDQLFQQPEGPILPHLGGFIARALLEIPAARAAYLERVKAILAEHFRPELLERRIDEVAARLLPILRQWDPGRDRGLEHRVAELRGAVRTRFRSVERQLVQRPSRPLAIGRGRRTSLAAQRWYPEKDVDGVEASEVKGDDGAAWLLVDAHDSECLGSWRCRLLLGRGAYTFRAVVRTEGVVPLTDKKGAGAGLRLGGSKTPRRNQALGDSDWHELTHDFEVLGASEEVELVCELRATGGRAWFDRASLGVTARSLTRG